MDASEWQRCADLAVDQCVAPLLYSVFRSCDWAKKIPQHTLHQLRWCALENNARNQRINYEVAALLEAANERGIPVIVLKGCHLACRYYPAAGMRFMGDYDLLVRPLDLAAMREITARLGYEAQHDPDTDLVHHLPPLRLPNGVAPVEIHWTIVDPKYQHLIDVDDLRSRAERFEVNGVPAFGLCPEDLLLHLCYHAGHHHLFTTGLKTLCDVVQILNRSSESIESPSGRPFDWDTFCDRSELWQWNSATFLTLRLAHDMLGAEIPQTVLDRLCPESVTEEVINIAGNYVFLKEADVAQDIFENHVRLAGTGWLARTLRNIPQRLFPPTSHLQSKYGRPGSSWRSALQYPRHWYSVFATAISRRTAGPRSDSRRNTRQQLLTFLDQTPGGAVSNQQDGA